MTDLKIPASKSTVRVRLIDTTSLMTIKAESFVKPVQKGHELINITDVAFLIEHGGRGEKVLFDAGVRKDYWNLPDRIQNILGGSVPSLRVDKDVSEILEENSIDLGSVNSVVWSHYHWDHTGNVALFPHSTSIVVGPGFMESPDLLPGFPEAPKSPVMASDFAKRTLTQIDFNENKFEIGDLAAFDYFADGSFYLLDTPGHCIGHMCGLARTSSNPDKFIFMGGDICHFSGDFRPNPGHALPDPIPGEALDKSSFFPSMCPCSLFTEHHPRTSDQQEARQLPWYDVADGKRSAYVDPKAGQESVRKMQKFDESEDVFVCIAHDPCLPRYLPTLNDKPEEDLNAWDKWGWKQKCQWDWLNELPRDGKPGRKPIVEGFWRDGKQWDRDRAREERL